MNRKTMLQIAGIVLTVAGFYLYLYRDAFRKPEIRIFHTIRPPGAVRPSRARATGESPAGNLVIFGMGRDYRLTSVKVVPVDALKTNPFVHPLWELVSASNSAPTRAFNYGGNIRGMHPAVKGATPDPLVPGVPYRLLLEAGSLKGQHDFFISESNHLVR